MANAEVGHGELRNTGYEIFIGVLSILSIVNLVLMYAAEDPNLDTVLRFMNGLLSAIFFADFTYRLFTAESKSVYFLRRYGWVDLLASLPFPQFKVLRSSASFACSSCFVRTAAGTGRPHPAGSGRERAAHSSPDGDPGSRVRQPGDPPHRAVRAGCEHHVGV